MQKAPQITRTDDALIWVGGFLCLFGLPATFAALSGGQIPAGGPAFFAGGGIAMLALGHRIRRREKRIQAVWRMLNLALEVRFDDVRSSTGLSDLELQDAVQALNAGGHGFWVVDMRAGSIVDGRLRATVTASATCTSCGATTSRSVALSSAETARCEHCGAAFSPETLNRLKLEAMAAIRAPAAAPAPVAAPEGYNPTLGMVLLIAFWPVGLIYYLRYHGGRSLGLRR